MYQRLRAYTAYVSAQTLFTARPVLATVSTGYA